VIHSARTNAQVRVSYGVKRTRGMKMSLYDIEWNARSRTLVLTVRGFWPASESAEFEHELASTLLGIVGSPFDVIADMSERPPQSAVVVDLQSDILSTLGQAGMRTLVFVGARPLLTRQAKRASRQVDPIFVNSMTDAFDKLKR
jgi:hypothetical protein